MIEGLTMRRRCHAILYIRNAPGTRCAGRFAANITHDERVSALTRGRAPGLTPGRRCPPDRADAVPLSPVDRAAGEPAVLL